MLAVHRLYILYIGLLPETVCMPYSGLIVAVYRPCTGRIQADSVLVVAAADILGNYPKMCIQSTQEGVVNS